MKHFEQDDTLGADSGLLWIRIHRPAAAAGGSRVAGIPLSQWRRVVGEDPSLVLVDHVDGVDPSNGAAMRIPVQDWARWRGHPDSIPYVFEYRAGSITIASGDRHVQLKAQALAALLDATVEANCD